MWMSWLYRKQLSPPILFWLEMTPTYLSWHCTTSNWQDTISFLHQLQKRMPSSAFGISIRPRRIWACSFASTNFFSMQSWAVIQPNDCLELGKEPLWKSSKKTLLWNRQLKSLILSHPLKRILSLPEKKHWWLSTMEKRGKVGYSSFDPLLWKGHQEHYASGAKKHSAHKFCCKIPQLLSLSLDLPVEKLWLQPSARVVGMVFIWWGVLSQNHRPFSSSFWPPKNHSL